ncbi:MMPL family transporter [Streptomyces sp. NPDC020917]|uniref:MMPL family transporter n=1 Tax=Streptomyces sp. NPDC020917 TaxID=3365102 RepID=UPI0037A53812
MLSALARLATGHPRRTLLCALAAFVLAAVLGVPALGALNAVDPFSDPASPSSRAQQLVKQATGREQSPGAVALVSAPPGAPVLAEVARTMAGVPGVAAVAYPTPAHHAALVSTDGRSSLVTAWLTSTADVNSTVPDLEAALRHTPGVLLGGSDVAGVQTGKVAQQDLGRAEAIAFPVLAILALLIFRGLAALLPIAAGATAVVTTFLVLRLVNYALPLSIFALNLVIGLGLGLAVDYSLFLVWRFREELAASPDAGQALRVTLSTTGRTVVFSAITVAAALASLAVFPQRFLVSMGIGGAAVALISAAAALLITPSMMMLLRRRIGRARPLSQSGAWYRLAHAVMRRPLLVALVTSAVLLVVASPALGVRWSGIDATVLPTSQSARVVSDRIAADFPPADSTDPITVVAQAPDTAAPALTAYAAQLARVPGIAHAAPPVRLAPGVWQIVLTSPTDPISAAGQQTLSRVRATPAPAPVLVGGQAAIFADQKTSIAAHVPLALIVLAAVTLFVLWLMTASVILPVKTLLMNALTAACATGVLVFVFQHGRLTGPLHYTSQGGIEETDFLILAALAFALSTDYGVFLLARIRESRGPGIPEREAIAIGMQRTGRLVTAAAILLAVAVGAFAISTLAFLKELGVGVAVAVLIDAFVVRTLLVPSLMALLGRWNWWQPPWLERLHHRVAVFDKPGDGS